MPPADLSGRGHKNKERSTRHWGIKCNWSYVNLHVFTRPVAFYFPLEIKLWTSILKWSDKVHWHVLILWIFFTWNRVRVVLFPIKTENRILLISIYLFSATNYLPKKSKCQFSDSIFSDVHWKHSFLMLYYIWRGMCIKNTIFLQRLNYFCLGRIRFLPWQK